MFTYAGTFFGERARGTQRTQAKEWEEWTHSSEWWKGGGDGTGMRLGRKVRGRADRGCESAVNDLKLVRTIPLLPGLV